MNFCLKYFHYLILSSLAIEMSPPSESICEDRHGNSICSQQFLGLMLHFFSSSDKLGEVPLVPGRTQCQLSKYWVQTRLWQGQLETHSKIESY